MDRTSTLPTAASSWFAAKGVDEVVLVDWGSLTPALDSLPDDLRKNPRLVHARVTLRRREWVLSRAYNLGLALAGRRTVLKVDCDTRLDPDFLTKHPLRKGTFYAGDWRALRKPTHDEHLHVNGLLLANRDDVLAIGAYDERITTYGWDDSDITQRLAGTLELLRFDYALVSHIPHDSSRRVALQGSRALLGSEHPLAAAVEIQRNRLLLTRFNLPPWRPTSPRTSWNIQKGNVDVFSMGKVSTGYSVQAGNEIPGAAEMVSEADAEDVAKRAVRVVLLRYGVRALPKTVSLAYFKSLADKVAWPQRYAEVAVALSGGCLARILAHVTASTMEKMEPLHGFLGWRMRQWWAYPSSECECAYYNILEAGDAEVTATWETDDVPKTEFNRFPARNGKEIRDAFDHRAIRKSSLQNSSKILMATLACGGAEDESEVKLIREGLRALTPGTALRKAVENSLRKSVPSLLDSEAVRAAVKKKNDLLGADPLIRAMAAKWGGNSAGARFKLIERASALVTVLGKEARDDAAVAGIGARMDKRMNHLFRGCEHGALGTLEKFPELAVIAAAFVSAAQCVKVAVL